MKRLALITLTIGATLLGIVLLWVFRPAIALFAGSLALSAALRPAVRRLEERGVNRGVAIMLCYLALLVLLAGAVALYGLGIAAEISAGAAQAPAAYEALRANWADGTPAQQAIARALPDFAALVRGAERGADLAILGDLASGAIAEVVLLLAVLSLAYYWLIEVAHFERLWLSQLPVGVRVHARDIWRRAEVAVGAYIRTTVWAVLLGGLLLLGLYTLLGLPFVATLALLGGLAHLVPRLGPAIALLPAVLVGLSRSPLEAGLVLLGGGLVQLAIHHLSDRSLRSEAVRVNPLLQVLLLLTLFEVGGLGAMIFAPPLAALIQVLYSSLLAASKERATEASVLERLVGQLAELRAQADPERRELASTLQRSDELLRQARLLLEED